MEHRNHDTVIDVSDNIEQSIDTTSDTSPTSDEAESLLSQSITLPSSNNNNTQQSSTPSSSWWNTLFGAHAMNNNNQAQKRSGYSWLMFGIGTILFVGVVSIASYLVLSPHHSHTLPNITQRQSFTQHARFRR